MVPRQDLVQAIAEQRSWVPAQLSALAPTFADGYPLRACCHIEKQRLLLVG